MLRYKDDKRTSDARKLLSAYKAMTTPEEKALLTAVPRDMSVCGPIVNQITQLLVKRITQSYAENHIEKPKLFGRGKLLINTLCANITQSKLIIEPGNFRVWRSRSAVSSSAGASSEKRQSDERDEHESPRKSPRALGQPAREVNSDGREWEEGSADEVGEGGCTDEVITLSDDDLDVARHDATTGPTT